MTAFAANSVLTRLGVAQYGTAPEAFAVIRAASGALVLCLLAWARGGGPAWRRAGLWDAAALALYLAGFSLAYRSLDTGTGALILFGGVQITMFAGAVLGGERVPLLRWIGAGVALLGLAVLLRPGGQIAPLGAGLMAASALGWGLFSLRGRGVRDPLAASAAAFALATPMLLPLLALSGPVTAGGALTAMLAGAVTSGLGYWLWYGLLPRLGATRASVAQLSVPVLAALGGLMLGEALTARLILSSAIVIGGLALSLLPQRNP